MTQTQTTENGQDKQNVARYMNRVNFVQNLIDDKALANVYLMNGIKLVGQILSQDANVIVITSSQQQRTHMVYLAAIATIQVRK